MKYMGSKSRIAGHIVPILQSMVVPGIDYIEPFCGGCNVIDRITAVRKLASDNNPHLIALLRHVQAGGKLPLSVPREEYSAVRSNREGYEPWYVGAVGFLASYNGRFFDGGYAGIVHTKAGTIRDYYDEARRNLLAQNLAGITFDSRDYRELRPHGAVIYCDPPYSGMKQYAAEFDHREFWEIVRAWGANNTVIVSEQSAPDDFKAIWEQPVTRTVDNTKRVSAVEKLFVRI